MFGNTLRKLKIIETAVVAESGKYVDKFEALKIAALDLDDKSKSNSGTSPELKKLNCFATDLNEVLNEGYIEQQSKLMTLRMDISECLKSKDETLESGKPDTGNTENSSNIMKPIEIRLKHQLHYAYDKIYEIVDIKTSTLQLLHRLFSSYVKSVVAVGDESGVLHTAQKVEMVTAPYFQPLLQNKFFVTQEVHL